jgi:hypothetical protein
MHSGPGEVLVEISDSCSVVGEAAGNGSINGQSDSPLSLHDSKASSDDEVVYAVRRRREVKDHTPVEPQTDQQEAGQDLSEEQSSENEDDENIRDYLENMDSDFSAAHFASSFLSRTLDLSSPIIRTPLNEAGSELESQVLHGIHLGGPASSYEV